MVLLSILTYVNIGMSVCIHACVRIQQIPQSLYTLIFEGGLLSEPGDYRFGKVSYAGLPMCSEDPNVSTFPVPGLWFHVPVPDSLQVC